MELKGKKINFLGDSITEGSGASCIENRYTDIIAREEGAVCRNYGIGGTRYARQKTPSENPLHDLDFCSRALEMDEDADIVVIFGGTNDFGHGDAEIGSPDDRTSETFWGAAHTLYQTVCERFPNAQKVVITPLHRLCEDCLRGDGYKSKDAAPLKTYVNIIREVAEYYSLPVLDLYKTSGLQPEIPLYQEKFMPDGLHPNDAGYRILADKIAKFLKTL